MGTTYEESKGRRARRLDQISIIKFIKKKKNRQSQVYEIVS